MASVTPSLACFNQHRAALDAKLAQLGRKPRIRIAKSDAAAKEKERQYLESIRPEGGLVEMSAQYNVDFSKARPGMQARRLC